MKGKVHTLILSLSFIFCVINRAGADEVIARADFVQIEGGCFEMGDQFGDGLPDELPLHRVCVSDFYMSKYEVTQEQYLEVMGTNPSRNQDNPRYPVDVVSWHEVQAFIDGLNSKTRGGFRLPTEAEWEYVCRAGGKKVRYGTADGTTPKNFSTQSGEAAGSGIKPVGSFPPNELGVYDMVGNVSEWVLDLYDREFYKKSPVNDPKLTEDKTKRSRVRRGGYWESEAWVQRCTFRNFRKSNYRLVGLGFRLAKDP